MFFNLIKSVEVFRSNQTVKNAAETILKAYFFVNEHHNSYIRKLDECLLFFSKFYKRKEKKKHPATFFSKSKLGVHLPTPGCISNMPLVLFLTTACLARQFMQQ